MKIFINGIEHIYKNGLTIEKLISELGYSNQRIAIELNKEIITRSEYANRLIVDGDKLEIIKAIGGG